MAAAFLRPVRCGLLTALLAGHHADGVLFGITRRGLVPPYAPRDYRSDMPAFEGKLADDQIWAVLAYLKSRWKSRELLETRAEMLRNARTK